ncbi:MAG: hypothetical protein LQ344_001407 [Seirophora lacunosa]|nr:MAG: hypothetical protein LQ344_001407 [Seirophora lacunosa]
MVLSTNPTITPFLSLLPSLTFWRQDLQIAFGWTNSHMHTFSVDVDSRREIERGGKVWLPTRDEGIWRLRDVFEKKEWEAEDGTPVGTGHGEGKVTLRSGYDMVYGWIHIITLFGCAREESHPGVRLRSKCHQM